MLTRYLIRFDKHNTQKFKLHYKRQVGFTGSTEIGKVLKKAIAGTGKKISLELGGKIVKL